MSEKAMQWLSLLVALLTLLTLWESHQLHRWDLEDRKQRGYR
jgi:hypothetical protein